MTAPIEVSAGAAEAAPDAVLAGIGGRAIRGRSLGQIAWLRLRRDRGATAGGVVVGAGLGVIAGYVGGWVDSLIARGMDVFLAIPLLAFAIALVDVIPSSAFGLSGNTLRVVLLVVVIGLASGRSWWITHGWKGDGKPGRAAAQVPDDQ